MTIPSLNDDYYFYIVVVEKTLSPHSIYLKIQVQTRKPDEPSIVSIKVADYDVDAMDTDPNTLIENAIIELHSRTPQYFKDFEDPEEKFNRALRDAILPRPEVGDTRAARLLYPDFLNPNKMDETTIYGLLNVLKNYCEVLPNTVKNVRPPLNTAQMIAVLQILKRLTTADRLGTEMDDLFDALSPVLESSVSGEYYDLPANQWEAVEHYYALLAKKVGLSARNTEGDLIILPEYKDILD